MSPVMESVKSLSTDEKFTLINLLWRDIADESDLPVPDWHLDVLKERERTLADGSARLLDWEDVKADLQAGLIATSAAR